MVPGSERAVVQWVLGEEEGVGVIAECCDSRLHSLHRAVGVRVGVEQEGVVVSVQGFGCGSLPGGKRGMGGGNEG